jgi:hypothetical protein
VALARDDRPKQHVTPADLVLSDLGKFSIELLKKENNNEKCSTVK